jgi:hypothetical protein
MKRIEKPRSIDDGGYLMRIAIALLALALTIPGCKKKEDKPTDPSATGSAAIEPGTGTPGGTAGDATTMNKKAGNCPSTVFGAVTTAELKGSDVVVTITSEDKDAVMSIQRRTDELIGEKRETTTAGGGHDGKGTHGGAKGICPVYVPEGGTATSAKVDKGVTVTITPKDKVAELKQEIDGRITRSAEWTAANVKAGEQGTQGGVGGGRGEHGGNHSGQGDSKGVERKDGGGGAGGHGGGGGGGGTGGGGGESK